MFGKRKSKRYEIYYGGFDNIMAYRPLYMDWRIPINTNGSAKVELTDEEKLAAEKLAQALCDLIRKERVL